MKINKLTIILLIIIIVLVSYIVYDKLKVNNKEIDNEEVTLKDKIELDYVKVYLLSDGSSYIIPINEEEIDNLSVNNNLKDRLKTLYLRSFYYNIYIDNYQLKGFKVNISNIKSINLITSENNKYIVFIKENNTIGLFNYMEYYDNLDTNVLDNYLNIKDVLEIKNNKLIYLDGSSNELLIEE